MRPGGAPPARLVFPDAWGRRTIPAWRPHSAPPAGAPNTTDDHAIVIPTAPGRADMMDRFGQFFTQLNRDNLAAMSQTCAENTKACLSALREEIQQMHRPPSRRNRRVPQRDGSSRRAHHSRRHRRARSRSRSGSRHRRRPTASRKSGYGYRDSRSDAHGSLDDEEREATADEALHMHLCCSICLSSVHMYIRVCLYF